jgi:hypothetical protein
MARAKLVTVPTVAYSTSGAVTADQWIATTKAE